MHIVSDVQLRKQKENNSLPISTWVRDDNIVILVYSYNGAGGAEAFKHSIRPSAVTVLQGLYQFQIQIDVYL